MTITDILLAYVAKQHGMSEEQVAALVYEAEDGIINREKVAADAVANLLSKDVERVAALRDSVDKTKIFTDAYAKAKGEERGKIEKALSKAYGTPLEKGQLLTDYVDGLIASKTEGQGGELTPEAVKAHPAYMALERSKTAELKEAADAAEAAVQKVEQGYARTAQLASVKGTALTHFDNLKPVLSKDVTKAANQRERFTDIFDGYTYKQDGDTTLILNMDGSRVEDSHGNAETLEAFTERHAALYYDFAVQSPKGSTGNGGGGNSGNAGTIQVPTTMEELDNAILNEPDIDKRIALEDAFNAANGGS